MNTFAIETTSEWNTSFFNQFFRFHNEIYAKTAEVADESILKYQTIFGEESKMINDFYWKAFLIKKDNEILARGVFSYEKKTQRAYFGFLEFLNNQDAFNILFNQIEQTCIEHNITTIKGPLDLHFFIGFRFKAPNGKAPFYGEKVVPDYYHHMLHTRGYNISEKWDSFEIDIEKSHKTWRDKRKKTGQSKKVEYHNMSIRHIFPWNFSREMKNVHFIMMESYKNMTDYMYMDWDTFEKIYSRFKFIINPYFSYVAYYKDEAVGFTLTFFDPLPLLKSVNKGNANWWQIFKFIVSQQFNNKRLLIMYSGKTKTKNGEEIKGLQIKVSKRIAIGTILFRIKQILVCFQSETSPSKRSFDSDAQSQYAQYFMYEKKLNL